MDDFLSSDFALNSEPAFYMPLESWFWLGLILFFAAIGF
jgi:hypothetical protein